MNPQPVSFHRRISTALADDQLRLALGRTTERFAAKRAAGLASLPDVDAVRDRARAIRLHTLSRLDTYLEQFEAAVSAAGGQVHWAADAKEASAIVLDLARARSVERVVKSKSMVSEEIALNETLIAAGLDVVESDLGEYIIQLAGETPSHIIAPAVHKTREQVGQLFADKLGVPVTDDVGEMTATARSVLREVFLRADMGVSGVNFGVAATGSLAIVTNEGNASLAVTAPRIHVAMMGIERLVPNLDDLAVMLQILARSATGQKLTVYTDLLTGPRRGDPDGPEELHVVLVDNGRSRLVGTEVGEILACIRCGACLNACPVYQQIGGHAYGSVYSGPVGAVLTPSLDDVGPWNTLPDASSLCGACREACPVRIDIPRMLLALRARSVRAGTAGRAVRVGFRLYRWAATRPWLFRRAVAAARWLTELLAADGWVQRLPPPLSGWTRSRDFPVIASRTFSERMRDRAGGAG
ncbi:MAG: iron-sulfur cluster-binding protein [Acidobacteria bacterium]|nr:iron-sulfur cluster-binding protein [Acidobacteriota bacterium]